MTAFLIEEMIDFDATSFERSAAGDEPGIRQFTEPCPQNFERVDCDHPTCPRSQFAHRLPTAKQQFGHDRNVLITPPEDDSGQLTITFDVAAGGDDDVHEVRFAKLIQRHLDVICVVLHEREPIALLIAPGDDRIDRHRVGVRRCQGFFDEHTKNAALFGGELLWGAELNIGHRRVVDDATCCCQ